MNSDKKTSEGLLGIINPPDHQCAKIDTMVIQVEVSINFSTQALQALDKQTVVQANKESLARMSGIPDDLETLRSTIEDARSWGQGWKDLAKRLIDKHEPNLLVQKGEFDDDVPFK